MAATRREKNLKIEGDAINVRAEIYTSALGVVEDCKNRPVKIKEYNIKSESIKKKWSGVDSYEEALELLANGYQPVVDGLKDEIRVSPTEGPRVSFHNEIQGFAPVVPLALKGIPESMVDMRMKPMKSKVIDVYYDMTSSAMTDPEEFIKAGKALLGAIIALEKQGYRFNLFAMQDYCGSGSNGKTVDFLCVKVKASDRPLDIKRISFPLTHPAFFRVIGFDWQGKSPITRDLGFGRGHSIGYDYDNKDITDLIRKVFGENAFYVSCCKIISSKYDKEKLKEDLINAKPKATK